MPLGSRGGGFILELRGGRGCAIGRTGCGGIPCLTGMAIITGGEEEGGNWAYICCKWEADHVPCLGGSMMSCCCSCC